MSSGFVALVIAVTAAAATGGSAERAASGWKGLPAGDVLEPFLADPKQPQSQASALWGRSEAHSKLVGAVAFGENIGLVRWPGRAAGDGVQLGLAGAVFAQFDLLADSSPLMNADYVIGLPLTWRRHRWSARARAYHQSSHLGDEYLIAEQPERVDLSFEALELLGAVDARGARLYGGGELVVRARPSALPSSVWHVGLDYRHPSGFVVLSRGEGRLVAGIDVKRSWSRGRDADVSIRAGIELGRLAPEGAWRRRWAVVAQYHDGDSPYGQFYSEHVSFLGVGVQYVE